MNKSAILQRITSGLLIALIASSCSMRIPATLNPPTIPPSLTPPDTQAPTPSVQPTQPLPPTESPPQLLELRRFGKGYPYTIAYSERGGYYVIGSSQGFTFYDASTLSETAFYRHGGVFWQVGLSPDGSHFGFDDLDNILVVRTDNHEEVLNIEGGGFAVTFSSNNALVAYVNRCTDVPECRDHARVWSISHRRQLFDFLSEPYAALPDLNDLAFNPDGTILAAAAEDHSVHLWDISTGLELPSLRGHSRPVTTVEFSPDATILASASEDHTVRLWDLTSQSPPEVIGPLPASIDAISFSADGSALMIRCNNGSVQTHDAVTGEILYSQADVPDHIATAFASIVARDGYLSPDVLAYSPDGAILAAASHSTQGVFFFDVQTGECLGVVDGERVIDLDYADVGAFFVIVQAERGVRVLDAATRKLIRTINTGYIYDGALSPGSRFLALNTSRGIELWELATASMATTIPIGPSRNIAFSADGSVIFADRWPTFGVSEWSVPNGRLRSTYQFPTYPPYDKALGLDHRSIALHGDLKTSMFSPDHLVIDLYPIGGFSEPTRLEGITYYYVSLEFTPDGRLVLVPYVEALTFFDRTTGRAIYTLHESPEEGSVPSDFAFSPDGDTMAAVSYDGEIIIWDISSIVAASSH